MDNTSTQPTEPADEPNQSGGDDDNPDAVPEPGTLVLLAVGLGAGVAGAQSSPQAPPAALLCGAEPRRSWQAPGGAR